MLYQNICRRTHDNHKQLYLYRRDPLRLDRKGADGVSYVGFGKSLSLLASLKKGNNEGRPMRLLGATLSATKRRQSAAHTVSDHNYQFADFVYGSTSTNMQVSKDVYLCQSSYTKSETNTR